MTEHKGKRFKTQIDDSKSSADMSQGQNAQPRFKSNEVKTSDSSLQNLGATIPEVVTSDQPFVVSPEVSGILPKLDAGEGAVITNRSNAASTTGSFAPIDARRLNAAKRASMSRQAHSAKLTPKKAFILLVSFIAFFAGLYHLTFNQPEDVVSQSTQTSEQRVKVAQDGEVEFRDFIFSLSKSDDSWELIGRPKSGEGEVRKYLTFEGTPVSLILFEGGFIVPENRSDDTWDIVTYTVSDGSIPSKLSDAQGNPIIGKGKVASAEVSGNSLNMTFEGGGTKSLSLK